MGKLWIIVKEIVRKGWPTSSKRYPASHRKANEEEKKHFGAAKYNKLNKWIARHIPKGQLAGKTTKTGRIEESSLVPKRFRREIRFHEEIEYLLLKKRNY